MTLCSDLGIECRYATVGVPASDRAVDSTVAVNHDGSASTVVAGSQPADPRTADRTDC